MAKRRALLLPITLLIAMVATQGPGRLGHGDAARAAASAGPVLSVDAGTGRHPISPDIYGMNSYAVDPVFAKELRVPVQRWGGDGTTRYNWLTDSSNAGGDWYFMGGNGQGSPAAGKSADDFVSTNLAAGSKSLLTMPVIGWVNRTSAWNCSYPESYYPDQQSYNPYVHPVHTNPEGTPVVDAQGTPETDNCGNGIPNTPTPVPGTPAPTWSPTPLPPLTDRYPLMNNVQEVPALTPIGTPVAPAPTLAGTPVPMADWVQHLTGKFGDAAHGGVGIYEMDNEPSGWGNTHRDIHPGAPGWDELIHDTIPYARMIKAVDPTAQIDGPGDFGVPAYTGMGKSGDDSAAHGGVEQAAYYLAQMRAAQAADPSHVRLLDYFDEHYYPSGDDLIQGCLALCPAGSAALQALRLQSTRSLWDPNYRENNWIGKWVWPIRLIPRMHDWVSANYPGTKLAISEYNFGGVESINGALAEADVLGIFGREGLDLATMWGPPSSAQPGAYAFRMFRSYDGSGGQYGDTWVQSSSADQGQLSVYGAQRSGDGALTLMVINKTGGDLTSALSLAGFTGAAAAQVYTYSGANLGAIVRQPDQAVGASGFSASYPADSITLIVLPRAGSGPTATSTTTSTPVPPTVTNSGTSTPTNTPVPPSATSTPVPPTSTSSPTQTPIPSTATSTPVPPTVTSTRTPIPPTATASSTAVPPTATNTATDTPAPPTATRTQVPPTATNTPVPATATNTSLPATATRTRTPVPPTATASAAAVHIAIDSGGKAAGIFAADSGYSGGSTYAGGGIIDTSGVAAPAPQAVYGSERYGNFGYTFANLTPGAAYTVRLHFAEIWWGVHAGGGVGSRVFGVSINGVPVLQNFDIYAAAGGAKRALVRQFAATADSTGRITIRYSSVKDYAKSSGIEVISGG